MTIHDGNGLSARQRKALPFFISTAHCEEACKKAGISRNCFYEWLKQPKFKAVLENLRNEVVQDAIAHLKINSTKAAETLISLTARTDNPSVQRAAANDILNHVMKFKEVMEIEQRLNEIERKISHKNFEE